MVSSIPSRGHADAEIEAVFAKYDLDGDRILDEDEQRKMQEDLEGQKVRHSIMKDQCALKQDFVKVWVSTNQMQD